MALRDAMRESAAPYLRPGEPIQAVFGAQTASPLLAGLTGIFVFLDAGKVSMKKARGVVTELPRSTRLGPGTGVWHQIQAGSEKLRVHRRFYKDIEAADSALSLA